MPFDQDEAGIHGVMLPSDNCGLYPLPALPFGHNCGAAVALGKPTAAAGSMPNIGGCEEVTTSVTKAGNESTACNGSST
ncbi:hypothetical protein ABZP36_031950, partial [Zizania latifolia]